MAAPARLVATLVRRLRRKGHEMTAMYATAFILGATAGSGVVHVLWTRWAEAHHYRRIRLEAARVDRIWHDLDHYQREARRERHRAWLNRQLVGDLTIQLAHATRPRHRRRSPVPAYGIHADGARIP